MCTASVSVVGRMLSPTLETARLTGVPSAFVRYCESMAQASEGFDLDRAAYLFELIAAELLNKFGLLIMAGLFITQHAGRLITVELIIMEVLLIVS